MTLWATITNGNTSDLAPLYTTTLPIFRGVGVQGAKPLTGVTAVSPGSSHAQSPLSLHGRTTASLVHSA